MKDYLASLGIINSGNVYHNLPVSVLAEHTLARDEAKLSETGALVVYTGKYTGRSPNDKFIVDVPEVHDQIDWTTNKPIEKPKFDAIRKRIFAYLQQHDLYVFDGFGGADPKYRESIRVINEQPAQNFFIHQLLVRPSEDELKNFDPTFRIVAAPGFKCDPELDGTNSEAAILVDFAGREVLICGTEYSGEIKKSVFTAMNYILPTKDVFPMHCSSNMGEDGSTAIFFGLSGTGKTTLSADPNRRLIGDDEHGWSNDGVFNIEGGCYAKCINLSQENEPEIWNAIKFGALVENVVMDENTREFDFDDGSITENTRVGYPVNYIPGAVIPGIGGQPTTVIFLTADAFGVLPPISKLTPEQAKYHFVSGYTSKLAGTERGITEPQTTFSTCFGAPFMPRPAHVYADMLGKKVEENNTNVYLLNTGWSGGPYGVGQRMSIKISRALVTAALNGDLTNVEYENHPIFNIEVPKSCPGVEASLLNPKETWADKAAYDKTAQELADKFVKNFTKYQGMPQSIIDAGPRGKA